MADIDTDELLKQISDLTMNMPTTMEEVTVGRFDEDPLEGKEIEVDENDPTLLSELDVLMSGSGREVVENEEFDENELLGNDKEYDNRNDDKDDDRKDDKKDDKKDDDDKSIIDKNIIDDKDVENNDSLLPPLEVRLTCKDPKVLEKYIRLEKVKAVQFKKGGEKEKALEALRASKLLEQCLSQINQTKSVNTRISNDVRTTTRTSPTSNTSTLSNSNSNVFAVLTAKIQSLLKSLKESIPTSNITAKSLISYYEGHLDALLVLEARGDPPPSFQYEERKIQYEIVNSDIAINQISFELVKCQGLYVNGQNIPDPYVSVEWPAFSSDSSPTVFSSPVFKKVSTTDFGNFSKIIPIPRSTNIKPYIRFLEKKRALVEVFHNRGFLFKSISLGRAMFPLTELLGKSTCLLSSDLVDDSGAGAGAGTGSGTLRGKKTGATIQIRLRQRQPAQGQDIREHQVSLIVFDSDAKSRFSRIFEKHSESSVTKSVKSITTSESVKSPASSSSNKLASAKKSFEEDDELFNVDAMLSNALMEKELARMNSVLASSGSAANNFKNLFADRTSQIQIKMNMLVLQVETGQLTMDNYLKQVKQAIAYEKGRALAYKKSGQLDHAKYCLWRMKVMTEEVKEVEDNDAN